MPAERGDPTPSNCPIMFGEFSEHADGPWTTLGCLAPEESVVTVSMTPEDRVSPGTPVRISWDASVVRVRQVYVTFVRVEEAMSGDSVAIGRDVLVKHSCYLIL